MGLIVPIENDEPGVAGPETAALLEIHDRTRGPTATENHRVSNDAGWEGGVDAPGPAFENLTIPRTFDIEDESVAFATAGSGFR